MPTLADSLGIGDTRIVRNFAWLPTRLTDRSWIWGSWYLETQIFESDESGYSTGTWERLGRWRLDGTG